MSDTMRVTTTSTRTARTEWFRMPSSWHLIATLLTRRAAAHGHQTARVVGVATGEEAYSLAMLFEQLEIPGTIHATDIDPELIALADAAVFTNDHVRQAVTARVLGPAQAIGHFVELGRGRWTVSPAVRARVTFSVADAGTASIDPCDIALARNMWRHLTDAGRAHLHRTLATALPAGGILGVGGADVPDPARPEYAFAGFDYTGAGGIYLRSVVTP